MFGLRVRTTYRRRTTEKYVVRNFAVRRVDDGARPYMLRSGGRYQAFLQPTPRLPDSMSLRLYGSICQLLLDAVLFDEAEYSVRRIGITVMVMSEIVVELSSKLLKIAMIGGHTPYRTPYRTPCRTRPADDMPLSMPGGRWHARYT